MSDDANLKWFDKLQSRDFANGAVIDAIRRVFKEHTDYRTQLATAQAEVERLKAAYERSESERLFAQGRMENQLNQKLQLKLDLEKRDEVLRVAYKALVSCLHGLVTATMFKAWDSEAQQYYPFDKSLAYQESTDAGKSARAAIQSCLNTTGEGEK
jgi:hypothetical protein